MVAVMTTTKAIPVSELSIAPEAAAKIEAMLDEFLPQIAYLREETRASQERTERSMARIEASLAGIDALLSK